MANVKYLGESSITEGEILEIEAIESAVEGLVLTLCWTDLTLKKGMKASYQIQAFAGGRAIGKVFDVSEVRIDKYFTVVLGACRPQMLKRIMEIAPTFPIKKIFIVASENAEKSYLSSSVLKERGYLKYLKKGVEQAGIPYLPEVQVIDKFWSLPKALEFSDFSSRIVCDGNSDLGVGEIGEGGEVLVAVGPEGGWSAGELELFARWGFRAVHLGRGILRVDVAFISVLSILRRDVYKSLHLA